MPQPPLELPDLSQDWVGLPPDGISPTMPDGVASSGGGLLGGLPMPAPWSPANSSLNAFVPPDVMKTIDFDDTGTPDTGGAIPGPVNGAAYFFTSPKYNGDPASAPRDFQRMLGHDLIAPVYPPRNTGTNNYFFNRNPYSPK
jgi:hypothetical protein